MPLELIPAIDLLNGQAVRLRQGAFDSSARVADDPVRVARQFAESGASRLHLVDLDGAKTGVPANLSVVRAIADAVSLPLQLGGGLRTRETIERVLAAVPQIARFVVGTAAASAPETIAEILQAFGDRVIIGADARNGRISVHGWTADGGEETLTFGRRLAAMGAARFLFTDISRDGMLEGVNVSATAAFADAVERPTLASGGVASLDDIESLARAAQQSRIEGVIIGKALYAERFTLEDARRVVDSFG